MIKKSKFVEVHYKLRFKFCYTTKLSRLFQRNMRLRKTKKNQVTQNILFCSSSRKMYLFLYINYGKLFKEKVQNTIQWWKFKSFELNTIINKTEKSFLELFQNDVKHKSIVSYNRWKCCGESFSGNNFRGKYLGYIYNSYTLYTLQWVANVVNGFPRFNMLLLPSATSTIQITVPFTAFLYVNSCNLGVYPNFQVSCLLSDSFNMYNMFCHFRWLRLNLEFGRGTEAYMSRKDPDNDNYYSFAFIWLQNRVWILQCSHLAAKSLVQTTIHLVFSRF